MKVRDLAFMGLLVAVCTLSAHLAAIPVGGAGVFPVQHAVNVIAGVLLGPGPSVIVAFTLSSAAGACLGIVLVMALHNIGLRGQDRPPAQGRAS